MENKIKTLNNIFLPSFPKFNTTPPLLSSLPLPWGFSQSLRVSLWCSFLLTFFFCSKLGYPQTFFFFLKEKKKSLKKAVPSWIFAWTVALIRKNLHHCWLSLIFSISYALKNLLHLWHWCSLCYPILQTSHYQNLTIYSMVNNFTV